MPDTTFAARRTSRTSDIDGKVRRPVLTPEQVAARLVEDGFAMRKPVGRTRCWATIELRCLQPKWGANAYVDRLGVVSFGATFKGSRRADPRFQRMVGASR